MHVLTLPHPLKQRLPDDRISRVGRVFSIFKFYIENDQSRSPWPRWVSGGRGDKAEFSDALFFGGGGVVGLILLYFF